LIDPDDAFPVSALWVVPSAGAAKVSSLAHAVPRHAGRSDSPSRVLLRSASVRRPRPRPARCRDTALHSVWCWQRGVARAPWDGV